MRLKFIEPMMPTLVEKPPEGDGWIHEVKFDGYRSQIIKDETGVRASPAAGSTGQPNTETSLRRPAISMTAPSSTGKSSC